MSEQTGHMRTLRQLLETQLLGVLGTQRAGEPYTSLVGFAATPDLKMLLFATGRSTRKHANLADDARASMLVDNRTNSVTDFTSAAAATAVGVVEQIEPDRRGELEQIYLRKHPQLESFVKSPSCVFLQLRVNLYIVVDQFQHVIELHVEK